MIKPCNKNININGNNTIAHAILLYPDLQINDNIQVQNTTYNTSIDKIINFIILDDGQDKDPTQKSPLLIKF